MLNDWSTTAWSAADGSPPLPYLRWGKSQFVPTSTSNNNSSSNQAQAIDKEVVDKAVAEPSDAAATKSHSITVHESFDSMGLSDQLLRGVYAHGAF